MLVTHKKPNLLARQRAFPHQLEAFEATKNLNFAAILHEQGLGKTKIGLDLILFWLTNDIVDSVMVVTKKGLIKNWEDEVSTHSFLHPRVLGQNRNSNFYAFNSPSVLYLTHYEVIVSEWRRLELFLKTRKVGILLDEAQRIKNPETKVAIALHGLASSFKRRIIMTGTPIANRPFDIWSQIKFLDDGQSLGRSFSTFRQNHDLSNEFAGDTKMAGRFADSVELIFDKIKAFTIRETKNTAGLKLPNKTIRNLDCELEPRQAELYQRFRTELAAIVVQDDIQINDDAESLLKRLLRLVQVASNPSMVDHSYKQVPGKFPTLERLVKDVVDCDEKIIVWTSFTENADALGRYLERFGTCVVHGGCGISDRERSLSDFKLKSDSRVLVATPGAAKEGLTLTVASHAVFFDRSFSLDDYLQAQDRIHRISQEKPCIVTNLLATNTIDCWVDALLSAKNLAAQLGQGDINRAEYDNQANYAFGEMLKDVLCSEEEGTK